MQLLLLEVSSSILKDYKGSVGKRSSFFIDTCYRAAVRVFPFFCKAKNASPLASKEKSREANRRFATCTVACAVAVAGSF